MLWDVMCFKLFVFVFLTIVVCILTFEWIIMIQMIISFVKEIVHSI